jgi:hypothetical protein
LQEIGAIDGGRVDAHAHFPARRLGPRNIAHLEDLRAARLAYNDGAHCTSRV